MLLRQGQCLPFLLVAADSAVITVAVFPLLFGPGTLEYFCCCPVGSDEQVLWSSAARHGFGVYNCCAQFLHVMAIILINSASSTCAVSRVPWVLMVLISLLSTLALDAHCTVCSSLDPICHQSVSCFFLPLLQFACPKYQCTTEAFCSYFFLNGNNHHPGVLFASYNACTLMTLCLFVL